jgi:hypothetical protein
MKRSQTFTQHSVDNKVKKWELLTSKLNTHIPYIKTQDIKSKGSKNRSPDFANPGKDRDFLSINESLFYLHLLFDKRIKINRDTRSKLNIFNILTKVK